MNWYKRILGWWINHLWTETMVRNAVTKGKITQEQCDDILSHEQA